MFIQAFEVAPLIELKDRMAGGSYDLPLIQLFGDVSNRRYRATPRDVRFHAKRGSTAVYGELDKLIEGGIQPDVSYAELATPTVLAYLAERYAAGIGPNRFNVLGIRMVDGALQFTGEFMPLLDHALAAGLLVHPWTLRAERPFLLGYRAGLLSVEDEAQLLLQAGVQGFFIDQPAAGRLAVDRHYQ